jgi:peptide-methionine (S)-S-oxide reductase
MRSLTLWAVAGILVLAGVITLRNPLASTHKTQAPAKKSAATKKSNTHSTVKATQKKGSGAMTASSAVHPTHSKTETASLAGGCFWCLEAIYTQLKGVEKVVSGYTGGTVRNPSYEQVCTGTTGHAETVQITYDPSVITYKDLLNVFFTIHDPTTLNRQGADEGTQYRSAIFYDSPQQKAAAEEVIKSLTAQRVWDHPIVTEVTPLKEFYPAEKYHQSYYERNPNQGYCRIVIAPKVAKFRQHFMEKLKK